MPIATSLESLDRDSSLLDPPAGPGAGALSLLVFRVATADHLHDAMATDDFTLVATFSYRRLDFHFGLTTKENFILVVLGFCLSS